MIDTEKLPKYYLVKKSIVSQIENEDLAENTLLPSERELIQKYNVSRITIRKALDELVNEGYLYRIQGKGTFIKSKLIQQDLYSLVSLTQDILSTGQIPSRQVLRQEIVESYPKRAEQLKININDHLLLLDRIYLADNEPVNRITVYLPYKYFPNIEKIDFANNSLYEVIATNYHIKITRAARTIEAIQADSDIAHLLKIKMGTPILLFRGITYGLVNNIELPIESFKAYYRSDNRKFLINQIKLG